MIDRVIGILGIALALITPFLPQYFPKMPSWLPQLGFSFGIFLIGLSLGLLLSGGLKRKRPIVELASLKLHISGDHRSPDRLSAVNIFRWYYLQTSINTIGPAGKSNIGTLSNLFITFEDDVKITSLKVSSPDMHLPIYEVKEFNQRYAIIAFSDNVPAGTLEVAVIP